jgi:rhodanese-related sulfurtransferase
MTELDDFLKSMTFNYFGSGQHKIGPQAFFDKDNALFLDVRSHEEFNTLSFPLNHHCDVLHVPIDEVPERVREIPKNKLVAIFCPASVRASMVFAYLKVAGYDNVKILEGGYEQLTAELKTGKLYKHLQNNINAPENEQ